MAKIGDSTTDDVREVVVEAMVRMASQGSVPAAGAVLKVLEQIEDKDATEKHREKVDSLKGADLARYFGEIGAEQALVAKHIGRELDRSEKRAWKDGRDKRRVEVRAVQLARVRAGGSVENWMVEE